MARHFNGFVSRFSAGGRALSAGDRQAATSLLQRAGVSPLGIQQFLAADTVPDPGDRQTLAGLVSGLLPAVQSIASGAPLLPAVQSARDPGRDTRILRELGLSAPGAQQFAAGLPVASKEDRQTLGGIVIAALGTPAARGGGANELKLDDTPGKEPD